MFARQVFKAAQPLRTVSAYSQALLYLLLANQAAHHHSDTEANFYTQQTRRYATEPASGGSNTAIYGGVAAVLAGAGYYFYNQGDNAAKVKGAAKDAEAKAKDAVGAAKSKVDGATAKSAFTGGDQGFISLKLDSVENINHNTKKFRFELPEGDQVSGLHVASALLTKYKGPEMEKPAIRPYTPVNDEGMLRLSLGDLRTANFTQVTKDTLISS